MFYQKTNRYIPKSWKQQKCGVDKEIATRIVICVRWQKNKVAIAKGTHLLPFRTEKLSPSAPMVLRKWESRSLPFLRHNKPVTHSHGLFVFADITKIALSILNKLFSTTSKAVNIWLFLERLVQAY